MVFIVDVVQLTAAVALGKPARELAVIHVSLAATYTDLRQHSKAVEHHRQELALRQGSPTEASMQHLQPHIAFGGHRNIIRASWI